MQEKPSVQQAPGRWPSVHVPGTAQAGVPAPAQGSPGRRVYRHSGKLYAKGLGRCSECPRAAAVSAISTGSIIYFHWRADLSLVS